GATGNPVANARIGRSRSVVGMQFDPLVMHQSATSDAQGRFTLRGLSAGTITLAAHADHFAPATSSPIALAEGEVRDGVTITLVRGATIHGFVGSQDGEPEAGSIVTCQQLGSFVPMTTTAGADGRYRLEGLAAGSYTVTKLGAIADEGGENAMSALFSKMATRSARVNAGEEATVDFISGARTGPALTGRVTEGGEPLQGAFLTFTPEDVETPTDVAAGLGAMRLVSTDADGMYRIDGLSAGDWSVTVQSGASLSDTARQTFEFSLSNLPEQRQDFALQATGIEGLVRAKDGKEPLKGVRVRIDATDAKVKLDAFVGATGASRVADLFTDQDGRFVARGLAAGRYRVSAGGPGFFGFGGTGFAAAEPVEVDVKDGTRTQGVDFDLEPGGAVRGTVSKPNGTPVGGASIFVVDANASVEPFAQVMTDDTGAFEVSGLAPGSHVVIARASGYAPAIEHGVRVRAEEKADVTLRVTEGANLTVVVTDAAGAALAGAKVTLTDPSGLALNQYLGLDEIMQKLGASTTEHDLGALAAGSYTLVVDKNGKSATTAVQHGGQAQTVTIALP
ncbi:MAG: carboxypeptidase regulatory-like domain-containing protein, partial [Planctomycetes bacterium]|nr:carboxypeptidase regulatory-like domain-containing protein [Planctomycetota bacterium]